MSTQARIRYRKTNSEGIVESVQTFVASNSFESQYKVYLDYNTMTYRVVNLTKGYAVKSTEKDGVKPPTHRFTLLKQARNALMALDVVLQKELRKDKDLFDALAQTDSVG